MEIKINRKIRNYQEAIFFGLTLRQFIFSLLAVGVAVGLYFGLIDLLGMEATSWVCILGAAPFVCGMQFTDKAKAGAALIETCKAQTDPKPHPIGQYCGFSILAEFDAFGKCFYMSLSGSARYRVELGTDAHGNIQRLDNQLKAFPDKIMENSAKIKELERQRENAKEEMEKPFPQEFELKQKQARLAELDAKLKINERGNEAAMPEPMPEETRQERGREGLAR